MVLKFITVETKDSSKGFCRRSLAWAEVGGQFHLNKERSLRPSGLLTIRSIGFGIIGVILYSVP
jgi:hypothetical protein